MPCLIAIASAILNYVIGLKGHWTIGIQFYFSPFCWKDLCLSSVWRFDFTSILDLPSLFVSVSAEAFISFETLTDLNDYHSFWLLKESTSRKKDAEHNYDRIFLGFSIFLVITSNLTLIETRGWTILSIRLANLCSTVFL